jgi:hypothetical protein
METDDSDAKRMQMRIIIVERISKWSTARKFSCPQTSTLITTAARKIWNVITGIQHCRDILFQTSERCKRLTEHLQA